MERLSKTELAATDGWKAHAQVLKEMLDHHIKEEERGIFEELGEHFTDRRATHERGLRRAEREIAPNGQPPHQASGVTFSVSLRRLLSGPAASEYGIYATGSKVVHTMI